MGKIKVNKQELNSLIDVYIAQWYLDTAVSLTALDLSKMFAEQSGSGDTALLQISKGNYRPSKEVAVKIARFLGVPMEQVFTIE